MKKYDVIVIGAGPAGCEAADAAARLGVSVAIVTSSWDTAGTIPCSPSIGGPGRAQLVCEIDALGGLIGGAADSAALHRRLTMPRKGPGVRALLTLVDKDRYAFLLRWQLEHCSDLDIYQDTVASVSPRGAAGGLGLVTALGAELQCRTAVFCMGTFTSGKIISGSARWDGGRYGEITSDTIGNNLQNLGLKFGRFRTGTSPRLLARSIRLNKTEEIRPDGTRARFSFWQTPTPDGGVSCWKTRTRQETLDQVLMAERGLLPAEYVSGSRHCLSLVDKARLFPEKSEHPIYIQSERVDAREYELQGLSISCDVEVQEQIVHTVPGLEEARITRPGYAVAYDYLLSGQLQPTLESVAVENLFTAGQINGTSGYEEAAAQGIVAGINAALKVKGEEPFILKRSQAYIGVLIDDLVNKEHTEPYRMFTSRAEHRLLLRQDNADIRLAPVAHNLGLIDDEKLARVRRKEKGAEECLSLLKKTDLVLAGSRINAARYLRRPEINFNHLRELCPSLREITVDVAEQVEVAVKYEGYVRMQARRADKQATLDAVVLGSHLDYKSMKHLSNEARERFSQLRPASIGQASRIGGVSPADIAVLMVELRTGASAVDN